ncbi:flagellar basal body rod protein FlgF [Thiolapillus sp.]|uniref:flagellar basal body rod protein FlgF n=1 Tax=Thiolapillus sp. TaxID=2017437 RepID=UPI003AF72846
MDRSLYIAMSGAKQTLLAQAANANNLANSQTVAFKSDLQQFRSMPVFGPGYPTRVYAMTERPGTDLTPGVIQTTGRNLDVAIKGDGWIAVQGRNGQEAYTRAGDFRLTTTGLLQTGTGLPVLGNDGPIAIPPADKLEIGRDGTISIIPLGDNAATLVEVDRIRLVKPPLDKLEKLNNGELHLKKGEPPLKPDASVTLVQGALEGSNVNTIDALVQVIELARNFELQVKAMQTTDENSAAAAKLMKMA